MKACTKCGVEKDEDQFKVRKWKGVVAGRCARCKDCDKIEARKWYDKQGHTPHCKQSDEVRRQKARDYYQRTKPIRLQKVKEYRLSDPARKAEQDRKYRKANMAKIIAQRKAKEETDVNVKLRNRLRSRMHSAVRAVKAKRSGRTFVLTGCNADFLKGYLEARFNEGMTWNNYGTHWHIDHRIPCAEFDLRDPDQQRQCFHYSNLQPLWKMHNLSKGDTLPGTHQAELI